MIHLILNARLSDHVSQDVIKEFEKNILSDPQVKPSDGARGVMQLLGALVWRFHERVSLRPYSFVYRYAPFSAKNEYFAILPRIMGIHLRKCMPYFAFFKKKHLYLFDAWPQYHDEIIEFVKQYDVCSLHVSAMQVVERLQGICKCPIFWVPEGIDPASYYFYPYHNKDIDVLEFGRKYQPYHEAIKGFLQNNKKVHFYEKTIGEPIFNTRESFVDGLARSKISICLPCSMTHPERSGDIETMTNRYLQSILAKSLIVGHAPKEMVELFGYNPVVEIDSANPCSQLSALLNHYEDFIPLIERNYNHVLEKQTWDKRWEIIKRTISTLP